MKKDKVSLIFVGILIIGCILYAGCSGGGKPGGGLTFFTSGSPAGGGGASPSPVPTSTDREYILAEGRTNTYDLVISGGYIYWTEKSGGLEGGVFRTKTDGTGSVETIVEGISNAYGLCIVGSNLYVTSKTPTTGKIVKVNLADPNFPSMDYVTGLNQPLWIKYSNGYLYWTAYEDPTDSGFYRVVEGKSVEQTGNVRKVAEGLHYPFGFYIDHVTNQVVLTEIAGNISRIIWFVVPTSEASFPVSIVKGTMFEVYSGRETYYGAHITYDTGTNRIYWCNYLSNSGVYRVQWDPVNHVIVGDLESVETGLAQAFDIYGPTLGAIFYSLNTIRQDNGNIYYDNIANLNQPSNTDIVRSTITYPFRFLIDGGYYYWDEYPYYDPTNLDYGGSSSCRIMKYGP